MRISDWSSDVCSSDLLPVRPECFAQRNVSRDRATQSGNAGPSIHRLRRHSGRTAKEIHTRLTERSNGAITKRTYQESAPRPRVRPECFAQRNVRGTRATQSTEKRRVGQESVITCKS